MMPKRVTPPLWPLLAWLVPVIVRAEDAPAPPRPLGPPVILARAMKGIRLGESCSRYYSIESRMHDEEGTTTLDVYIAPSGLVTDTKVHVPSGFDRLDLAAIECVKRAGRFEPQLVDGKPVGSWQRLRWTWRIATDGMPSGLSLYYGSIVELARRGDFEHALPLARDALAASRSTKEREVALRVLLHITAKMKDYEGYAGYAEQLLAVATKMAEHERINYMKTLARIHAQLQHADVALEWVRRVNEREPDLEAYELAGHLEIMQHRDAAAIGWLHEAVAASAQPTEQTLSELYGAYHRTGAATEARATLEALLAHYPKRAYLLLIAADDLPGCEARARVHLLRLLYERDALGSPAALLAFADAAMGAGSPGEAKAALEKSLFQKPEGFGADDAHARDLLARARNQVDADRRTLPRLEAEAGATDRADSDAAIAFGYLSLGENAKAEAAFERALAPARRATLERPDDALVGLGMARLRLGRQDAAVDAFREAGQDARMARVAALWSSAAHIPQAEPAGAH
jgi:TonB family protein